MGQTSPILPFDALLDVLRSKGYGVSLHEYAAMANLLEHWDRTNVLELGDAIAALVGRSDDEVEGVRRLFRELYVPLPPRAPAVAEAPPASLSLLRRHAWAIAAADAPTIARTTNSGPDGTWMAGAAHARRARTPPTTPESHARAATWRSTPRGIRQASAGTRMTATAIQMTAA